MKAKRDAEVKAAETALKAVMPYPFQLADPEKLGPAIEAAKKAGVAGEGHPGPHQYHYP